jgi:putative endonuclease
VVEHLLAKEDVASSSLVTRSSLRFRVAYAKGWSVRRSLGEGELTCDKSYGWQAIVMHYVYLLQSESHPRQRYIGITSDLKRRLRAHNNAYSAHTSKFRPWVLIAYFAFADKERAVAFERYLKSGSGRAFAQRHFV